MTRSSPSLRSKSNIFSENIWSSDVEQSFLEALAVYPPCGRRKIILPDEGKIYGRNELVARYIQIRTGKIRTRKQVSSHLQVLMKRRSKELQMLREDKEAQQRIWNRLRLISTSPCSIQQTNSKLNLNSNKTNEENQIKFQITSSSNIDRHSNVSPVQNLIKSLTDNNEHSTSISSSPLTFDPFSLLDLNAPPSTKDHSMINSNKLPVPKLTQTNSKILRSDLNNFSVQTIFPISPAVSPETIDQSSCSPLDCCSTSLQNNLLTGIFNSPKKSSSSMIGNENFRLSDLSTFVELNRTVPSTMFFPYTEICSIRQHDLVRLNSTDFQMQKIHNFETIPIEKISDKFPANDGLKSLFEANPNGPFFLIKFWADLSFSSTTISNATQNIDQSFFTSYSFSSCTDQPIQVSSRLCSFGKQVLEKVDISENPQRDQFNQFIYRFDRAPLCDYMVQFIQKLRSLPNTSMMNSVLENFTVLQVIRSHDATRKFLLSLAFVFEAAMFGSGGPKYQVYKLVNN